MQWLILFVYRYFVSRSFAELLGCSQTRATLGLTPSSKHCGPKPKFQSQGLGTIWLLGTIRIWGWGMGLSDLSIEEKNLKVSGFLAPHLLLL
jgi:hypothetical protein